MGPSKSKIEELDKKLLSLGINRDDIQEKFIRSSGKGGQNVNKVATCVYLKHIPTGTEVKCSKERSQLLNRFLALRLMAEKIEEKILHIKSEKIKKIEKIKRQKRKRSKRAKEKVLRDKKINSEKKKGRNSNFDGGE